MCNQVGYGMEPGLLMFRPNVRRQHGYGLGAWLGRLWQRFIPFARRVVIPHTAQAVENIAQDIFDGKDVKKSLKTNALGVLKEVGRDALNQTGSGSKRGNKRKKRTPNKIPSKKIKKKTIQKKKKVISKNQNKKRSKKKKKKKPLRKNNYLTLFD